MIEKIEKAFSGFTFLKPIDFLRLSTIAKFGTLKKNEHLLKEGDFNYNVIVVLKGLLRHYIIDKNGEEKTLRFVSEKAQTAMMDTIFHNKPATENIIALERAVYIKFDFREIDRLVSDNFRLLKLQNQSLKNVIAENVEQIKFLTILSPEERYLYFCKKHPNLEQRIKQKYLASFLGVTPTSLSRIRARVAQY